MAELPPIPQADPKAAYLAQREQIDAAIARVMASGSYILGREVEAFEQALATYVGRAHGVGVASGTDAVELALSALGVGPGDAVATVSHTAVATVAAIERCGALPVLVDIDPQRFTMDPRSLEQAIQSRARSAGPTLRAIVPVHLYGQPADITAILGVARRFGLKVVEDCAQSHGAKLGGKHTGAFGDAAAFSFYPTKNLGAFGDGGMVLVDDPALAERLRQMRQYGWRQRYISDGPGVNSRLDELQAAILGVRLANLDADNRRRRQIAERYRLGLAHLPLTLPAEVPQAEHAYHQFVVRCDKRDALRNHLKQAGVGTAIHYPVPVHCQPAYRDRLARLGDLPQTERAAGEILSLPMFPQLSDPQADRVIAACRSFAD